ncbi:hypothetical protein NUU61_003473 [Penicillium alfredii]|uniref:Uncharacterized protein n=1 Tax=Penicillium alfredii TaxID=1506179 RepID=A0A9W9KCZ0_9EURO|nr:uncharacterized protein NUU61_003473 [Penicillium alfredii]KAJ5101251.1 hypothetical protein NUU61_003473 [Penicillium alfredii]
MVEFTKAALMVFAVALPIEVFVPELDVGVVTIVAHSDNKVTTELGSLVENIDCPVHRLLWGMGNDFLVMVQEGDTHLIHTNRPLPQPEWFFSDRHFGVLRILARDTLPIIMVVDVVNCFFRIQADPDVKEA